MSAWVGGKPVGDQDAIETAGRLLGAARAAVVAGLAADVVSIRAAYRLAWQIGASVDVDGSDTIYADLGALAAAGAMTTTLAEARLRADCVLVVGDGPFRSSHLAAILEQSPRRGPGAKRSVVGLGQTSAASIQVHVPVQVPVASGRLPATLALLRGLAAGRLAATGEAAALAEIAAALRKAAFAVVIYDPGEIGDLAVEMLQGLVKDLNADTRCTSLPLGQPLGGRAALQVGAWTTADGPRSGFARGYPEHDPWRFDAARLVVAGETDAALWLAALAAEAPAWLKQVPTVALLGQPKGDEAEIVVKVAIPGEASAGVVWDELRGTLVHREARQAAPVPEAAGIIAAIAAAAAQVREAA